MAKVPIKLPMNVKLVPGFKCAHPGCSARLFASAPSAARHADKCITNPAQRTCATCEHDGEFHNHECMQGLRAHGVTLVRHCPHWVVRDGT